MAKTVCSTIQQSLAWCQGTPELPGIKRRIYYISKDQIVAWPSLTYDALGRLTSAAYTGSFVLAADATWKFIDILTDKSQLTSEAQGEFPSQTQLNKLVAVHPSVGVEASALSAYVNNNDCVYLVETVRGQFRVVGSALPRIWARVLPARPAPPSTWRPPTSVPLRSTTVKSSLRTVSSMRMTEAATAVVQSSRGIPMMV